MANQNITLSLPEEDLREARVLAARRGISVSQLLARMLSDLIEQESGYARARDRSLDRLREGTDLGTGGHIKPLDAAAAQAIIADLLACRDRSLHRGS